MTKYIDADLLRKEIEKERKSIDGLFTEGDNSFYDGQDDAYNHILSFIAFLQQEQPSESLEEAAEEYASINCDDYVDYDSNICFIEEGMRVAFKAGAEWQKEKI